MYEKRVRSLKGLRDFASVRRGIVSGRCRSAVISALFRPSSHGWKASIRATLHLAERGLKGRSWLSLDGPSMEKDYKLRYV